MEEPVSSYYDLAIHILLNEDSDAKIDPPIQTENFRS